MYGLRLQRFQSPGLVVVQLLGDKVSDTWVTMWTTIKVAVVLLVGFAAIVYLGTQAGLLDARSGKGSLLETCLTANGLPHEVTLSAGLDRWSSFDSSRRFMLDSRHDRALDSFMTANPGVREYFRWSGYSPTRGVINQVSQDQLHSEANQQRFLDERRSELMPLCR